MNGALGQTTGVVLKLYQRFPPNSLKTFKRFGVMEVWQQQENSNLSFLFFFVSESDSEWRTIRGKFLAINAASMSCACPRSPKGLSPAAHLADGTTDLIMVRKCSRFDFLRHLLRHTNKDDQVRNQRYGSLWASS